MSRTLAARAPRVRIPITEQLVAEAARYALRSACGDCAWATGEPGSEACLHGWPNEGQRRPVADARLDGPEAPEIAFCKEFELRS